MANKLSSDFNNNLSAISSTYSSCIKVDKGIVVKTTSNLSDTTLYMCGGTNQNSGATLLLYNNAYKTTSDQGSFRLATGLSGSSMWQTPSLIGTNSGKLQWNKQNVVRAATTGVGSTSKPVYVASDGNVSATTGLTAISATKATQDSNGNVITCTYQLTSTAVTHNENTSIGSVSQPVYIQDNGIPAIATDISISHTITTIAYSSSTTTGAPTYLYLNKEAVDKTGSLIIITGYSGSWYLTNIIDGTFITKYTSGILWSKNGSYVTYTQRSTVTYNNNQHYRLTMSYDDGGRFSSGYILN